MLSIKSRFKDYKVNIEEDFSFLNKLIQIENTQFVIDRNVWNLYETCFEHLEQEHLVLVDATEENKVIDTALDICEKITEISAKRNTTLISIGGGIIQDITGFVANVTYRGINWIFVPTTLLAACDSCIGGKTSLNYKKYKNLLGTFYPPDEIYICPRFFNTLSKRDYLSGLGEVVKFNLMQGMPGLTDMESDIDRLLDKDSSVINQYVYSSLSFKKSFIEVDEFDKGERIKLNFAHTFGHAIEVISAYEIPHGTAVAIGMIMANYVSLIRGYITKDVCERMERILLSVVEIDDKLLDVPLNGYLNAMHKDKKQVGNSLTAVLIKSYAHNGEFSIVHDLSEQEVEKSINHFIEIYESKSI